MPAPFVILMVHQTQLLSGHASMLSLLVICKHQLQAVPERPFIFLGLNSRYYPMSRLVKTLEGLFPGLPRVALRVLVYRRGTLLH